MCNIRSRIAYVAVHFAHDSDMFVTVEKRILFLTLTSHAIGATAMGGLVGLEAGIGEDNDKPLAVLIAIGNGYMLFSDKLRKSGRRKRLGALGLRHCC